MVREIRFIGVFFGSAKFRRALRLSHARPVHLRLTTGEFPVAFLQSLTTICTMVVLNLCSSG